MTDLTAPAPEPQGLPAFRFAALAWLGSRLVILISMLLIAPALPTPDNGETAHFGWEVFSRWDSRLYEGILTHGYEFRDDGEGHNVAFFPLFPLLIWVAMRLGLPFEIAGTLINNLAFLGALVAIYLWVEERYDRPTARWTTAALAWCPFSLFGSVIYTEGLFLLGSTLALRAFDHKRYGWAMLWGAMTTALRPPGAALIPTFLWVAWRERRGLPAYLAALGSSFGLLTYMVYCGLRFGYPLAFVLAQRGWQPDQAFPGSVWFDRLLEVVVGHANEEARQLVDPWYPLALLIVIACAVMLWRSRHQLGSRLGYGVCALVVVVWLIGGSTLINLVMVWGGAWLLWHFRHRLSALILTYGVCGWLFFLSSGKTTSTERYAYGVVSLAIAFGLLLTQSPRWATATLAFFAILLGSLAVRFAQGLWAG